MKISSGNKTARTARKPQYAITKHIAFWHLTFNGQKACFDHEQGAYYVAYLLLNPPDEPIHGMALELKASAYFGQSTGVTLVNDPRTGKSVVVPSDAWLQERELSMDDAAGVWAFRRKMQELEAILDDEDQIEPVKAEATRELIELYEFEKVNPSATETTVQKSVRAVRRAI